MTDARAEMVALRDELRRADRAYYVDAQPLLTDREYDEKLQRLAALEAEVGDDDPTSPTRRVGGEPIDGFETVEHAMAMLSIDNTYSAEDVRAWVKRVGERLGISAGDSGLFGDEGGGEVRFACDAKVDGVAISLRYEGGRLARALSSV